MAKDNSALQVSSGAEALIERLHDEGGQERAEKIVADAEHQAAWIVEQAELETEALKKAAREQAEQTQKALQESLSVAVRDAILSLKSTLSARFADEVQRAVGREMSREQMLQRLILEVAGRAKEQVDESDDDLPGIRLSIRGDAIKLDVTEAAVTELLLAHLQPRFRALVEGIVR
ncbi:MAG: ATP synthase subunit epsilon [Gammaproteobacteria bacterium (ex Lamellibrachia satsuma)]|nr:MAG: hypothetical protein HPY30_11515 [Gammaproteobacteria bacterium (ex Lamellibrachia satsuma)]RRS35757.1 MAG: ATP synthase subunit epsilon [Gammaproteobacteria bacterium (ex Lamellibrachia satsuma)]RRS36774.1 MAG: ATP synthase subunit epsilon [Gammaproteobacteria bacterium (ex Lamellibrachia satsuma)]